MEQRQKLAPSKHILISAEQISDKKDPRKRHVILSYYTREVNLVLYPDIAKTFG